MNQIEKSQKANDLRKNGDFKEAKELYLEVWKEGNDKFSAAGLLHCYRKLGEFEQSLEILDEIIEKYSDFNWVKIECIWTIIQGKLYRLPEDEDTNTVITIGNQILELEPEFIALKTVVFKVLKSAKKNKDWNTILEWIDRIDPVELEDQNEIKKDWTDQELWYYYKVATLNKSGSHEAAYELALSVVDKFPRKKKFFKREIAISKISQDEFKEGEKIYSELIRKPNSDWWLLNEYGEILMKNGKSDEAFAAFCKAAHSIGPLGHKVKLFKKLADILIDKNQVQNALAHLILINKVREREGWGVSNDIDMIINDLSASGEKIDENLNEKELHNMCKEVWKNNTPDTELVHAKRKNLRGKVNLGDPNKPFCFIATRDKESFFCFKSELPQSVSNGTLVRFDLKKSFDKKKKKESWIAINIHYVK
ncbi:hypothetical protein SAMN04488028_10124 [Reichenbachiella agariperforans]|uniref:Tetratricopeptide repeat-containing protein n=1 Tax=Reichenbachiella agariperforans TaxID=156994 RepID=A0A1M6J396_REIAG|nr:tetratricopeptide repeat protein [Reichenbachiella agariperforans]SHJ41153.1 hypothetical protein SAMN04488028_10124 [Reichenbachiella agariperforans]